MFKRITQTVWFLSLISLCNDFSSEMLYPVLPLYLQQQGYSAFALGILEACAEWITAFSKLYFGRRSDLSGHRIRFIQGGYLLSVISRIFPACSSGFLWLFTGRSLDKTGKGLRTAARDAMLSDECKVENRAEVFGFHRSMDTLGALFGPACAALYIYVHPGQYRHLFWISLLPGIGAVLLTLRLTERTKKPAQARLSFKEIMLYYRKAPAPFLQFSLLWMLFGLANSSDLFLIMKSKEGGLSGTEILVIYLLFNGLYALLAFPVGKWADRIGRFRICCIGLLAYILMYSLFTYLHSFSGLLFVFLIYAFFYACTQSTQKALVLESIPDQEKGSAIGLFESMNSISIFSGNLLAGWIWWQWGSDNLMYGIALYTGLILLLMIGWRRRMKKHSTHAA